MRDIGARIQRYRLSRYAAPRDQVRANLRWTWLLAALWLAWAGFLSDHNFYRIWQLAREEVRARLELDRLNAEIARLDREGRDPKLRREVAERVLRERSGMARPGEIIYRIESEESKP